MGTQISNREFDQDTSGARRATAHGPVYITDRGGPAYVLLTYEAYQQLLGAGHVLDHLAEPAGVEDVELPIPVSDDTPHPAPFG